jgi:hypothetical protein
MKSTTEKLNKPGTDISERVHLYEIVVILGIDGLVGLAGTIDRISPDRLP